MSMMMKKMTLDLGILFVISELQLTRKAKCAHQRLGWLAHVKKLKHENIFAQTNYMSFQALTALVDMMYQCMANDYWSMDTHVFINLLKQKLLLPWGFVRLLVAHTLTWRIYIAEAFLQYTSTGFVLSVLWVCVTC